MDIKVGFNGEGGGSELMLRHVYIFTVKEADVKNNQNKDLHTKESLPSVCLLEHWKTQS